MARSGKNPATKTENGNGGAFNNRVVAQEVNKALQDPAFAKRFGDPRQVEQLLNTDEE